MKNITACLLVITSLSVCAQKIKSFQLKSPDGKITVTVDATKNLSWAVKHENTQVIIPSAISLSLSNGEVLGKNIAISNSKVSAVQSSISTTVYKKTVVPDNYNQLAINFKNNYGVVFRAYNDGVAYRFVTMRKDSLIVNSEQSEFNFDNDYKTLIPYVREPRYNGDKFQTSFESLYEGKKLSEFLKDTLGLLPSLIELNDGKKAVILEADLEDYPGMYLQSNPETSNSLHGVYAPYPLAEQGGGWNGINYIVTGRANYIAKTMGTRNFPWRAIVISSSDKELANNDMVYKLASQTRVSDVSWIRPGKVAWDWWNDWNISHVDFKAGINTPTYKYYIDFAAANNIEYIVMDEGWSVKYDLDKISDKINLGEIINYGKQKNVGIILWATAHAFMGKLDEELSKYAKMGVKGFKVDFFDRDDQKMVDFVYELAKKAAENKLLIDMHGMYKPTGLQRTYPNVVGFEGVRGMENVKWAPNDDVPRYDVTLPYIRMMAGAMDYTPGAMRNSNKANFRPINSMPMSQGTRCHQMAMYTVFEAPLGMLSDNPTVYQKEQECTNFISKVPTVFDETVALDGKVGEYLSIARRNGDNWYVGAVTNWDARDITIDFSFLGDGDYEAEIFKDGINADRDATDYKREVITVSKNTKHMASLSNGGGWTARISPKK
ncbi:MAG TPA: glycoside hydrolase family 97 protein [Flavisolibacter sp.]|jgi:alpha-glucosidase|nr:glycoside hydrolase family 97 protein [Flavisolibacter sp.]